MTPLTGELGIADLAVLERWADPNVLVRPGPKRLTAVITKASHSHQGAERAEQWIAAARAALELYAGHPAVAFADLAAEVATEVRLLRAVQAELAAHAAAREEAYRWVDPARAGPQPARRSPRSAAPHSSRRWATRPGSAPARQFRSFTGLVPKASETGDTDRKGQPMSKAGPRCCAPRSSAPPTTPATKTPSWRGSTTSRWSSAARTTSARCAWSPPTSPNASGP